LAAAGPQGVWHPQAITAVPDGGPPVIITAAPGEAALGPGWTCSRTFPARADQVGRARGFLHPTLAGCPVADEILLICSELASNAVQHSASARPGGQFTVRAEVRERDYAWVEVEDEGGRWTAENSGRRPEPRTDKKPGASASQSGTEGARNRKQAS
jgi:anti-sigma regulatory factor (Ser/Thr protein kinase)